MKARPSAHSSIMDEDVTAQMCKTIPPEVYSKCHIRKCPRVLKGNLKSKPCGPDQKKVSFDHLNYYQYDTSPSNSGQVDGNRNSRRP